MLMVQSSMLAVGPTLLLQAKRADTTLQRSQEPATDDTYAATSAICCSVS